MDSASVAMNPLDNGGIVVGKDGLLLMDGAVTPALGLVWAHCVNTRCTKDAEIFELVLGFVVQHFK